MVEAQEPGARSGDAAERWLGDRWPMAAGDDVPTRAYISLLETPSPAVGTLLASGLTAAEADHALTILASRGLVGTSGRSPTSRVEVPAPDATIPTYVAELERQARTTRAAMRALSQVFHRARLDDHPDDLAKMDVQVLPDLAAADRASTRLVLGAQRDLLVAGAAEGGTVARIIAAANAVHNSASRPSTRVHRRAVVDVHLLEEDGVFDALRVLTADGFDIRVVPDVICSVTVVDRSVALIDVRKVEPSGYGSLVIRHPPLVEILARLAEARFSVSPPLRRVSKSGGLSLDDRDTEILTLLAAGASDSTIARHVRVSKRTVERRLRSLMDMLGAGTRFQAGVQAAHRGLI